MRSWLRLLYLALLLVIDPAPAHADLVLAGGTVADSFTNLGAQGFGDDHRLLTEQTSTFEFGSVTPGPIVHDNAISGADKSGTPTLGTLGWTSGAQVGIGFDADQEGHTGLTLQTLVLRIYDGNTVIGTFSLADPVTFTGDDLAREQGNGNSVWNFGLDATQQAEFDTLRAQVGAANFVAGLSSSLGCAAPAEGCFPSNDGPDSFIGFAQAAGTPVPEPTTLLLIGSGLAGLGLRARRRLG